MKKVPPKPDPIEVEYAHSDPTDPGIRPQDLGMPRDVLCTVLWPMEREGKAA